MPTFVAPNMEYNVELDDHYAPYNKPSAIAAWLQVCGCMPDGILWGACWHQRALQALLRPATGAFLTVSEPRRAILPCGF